MVVPYADRSNDDRHADAQQDPGGDRLCVQI
jgi:hypothetical protein